MCSGVYSSVEEKTDEKHAGEISSPLSTRNILPSAIRTEREEAIDLSLRENRDNTLTVNYTNLRLNQREFSSQFSTSDYSLPVLETSVSVAGGPPPRPRNNDLLRLRDTNLISIDEYMHRPLHTFLEDLFNSRTLRWEYTYSCNGLNFDISGIFDSLRATYLPTTATLSDSQSVDPSAIDQEALTKKREQIRNHYIKMATEGESADTITTLLPAPETIDALFAGCMENLTELFDFWERQKISDSLKFRINNAKRTLQLMSGNEAIEHHPISSVKSYSTFSYLGLPNARQLLILAWRLSKPDAKDFVEAMIAENWNTPAKWREWQQFFYQSRFANIVAYEDAGQSLRADREKGKPLVCSIAYVLEGGDTLPVTGSQRVISQFMKRFLLKRTEQIVPLVEALSMVMRGHNIELQNDREQNRPACAEGAYLGILKSIGEMVSYAGDSFSHITLEDCGAERLYLPQLNLDTTSLFNNTYLQVNLPFFNIVQEESNEED